jgi:deoxyribodipyrimidine photolyase-related protein
MPQYAELNALGAGEDLPAWYWTGETPMRCLGDAIGQTLEHGYAHHIQRLMVTGPYALLLGVEPQRGIAGTWASTSTRSSGRNCRTRWA